MYRAGCTKPTAYTRFVAVSITGVLVIPTGSTFPHGNDERPTGSPRFLLHSTVPSEARSAYTVSFSVATTTRSPVTSGCA